MMETPDKNHEQYWPSISYLIMAMSLTFGQRFVIPLGGRYEVGVSVVVCGGVLAYWFIRGYTYIHHTRLVLYLASVAGVVVCTAWNVGDPQISLVKVAYLVVIYAGWIFVQHDPRGPIPMFRCYQWCMAVIACLGLAQFGVQLVGIRLIDLLTLLPEKLVIKGFYSHQPLAWGMEFYKSNGILLNEPSYYSRMLAIALVIEMLVFRQMWRMVLYGVAILPAFSGTGLIILLCLYPRLLISRPRLVVSLTVAAALLLLPALFLTSFGRTFLGRSEEFSKGDASGRMRFIAPYTRLVDTFDGDYFLGHGPGTHERFENVANVAMKRDRRNVFSFGYTYIKQADAYANTLLLIIYEIGLIPGLALLTYIVYCFFRRVWSPAIAIALFLHFMILAGDMTQVETLMLCYSLGFMNIRPLAKAATIRQITERGRDWWPRAVSASATLR